jgi:hypothetical protein
VNTTQPLPQATDTAIAIDQLQTEISAQLTDLTVLTERVVDLVDTHQRGLGFLTPLGRQAMDRQVRDERAERRGQPDRVDEAGHPVNGLDWLNRTTPVAGTGNVPAPAEVPAVAMDAEIYFTLRDLVRRIVRDLDRAGICTLHRLPAEPTNTQLITHLRGLVMSAPKASLLAQVSSEVAHLLEQATVLVDGNDKAFLGDCPHCGNPTLVVYFNDGEIRCDRDPHTGHFGPCRCPDAYCDCKKKPISFRHTWHRDRAAATDGWWTLADRLNLTRKIEGAQP